jgi:hypothetical protein
VHALPGSSSSGGSGAVGGGAPPGARPAPKEPQLTPQQLVEYVKGELLLSFPTMTALFERMFETANFSGMPASLHANLQKGTLAAAALVQFGGFTPHEAAAAHQKVGKSIHNLVRDGHWLLAGLEAGLDAGLQG